MSKLIIPLLLIGGGIAFAISDARASAKKKKIDGALDLGLDDVDTSDAPLPPAASRAYPQSPINATLFNEWWQQTSWVQNGVMGFWVPLDGPAAGTDWILPNSNYNDVVLATQDGALWYHDNGWHPAPLLAQDYDAWYTGGGPLGMP